MGCRPLATLTIDELRRAGPLSAADPLPKPSRTRRAGSLRIDGQARGNTLLAAREDRVREQAKG
jgi:hypothetical protein